MRVSSGRRCAHWGQSALPGLVLAVVACGSDGASPPGGEEGGTDAAVVDSATPSDGQADAVEASTSDGGAKDTGGQDSTGADASCPPPPAALPDGPMTRNPTNPLLRNGPETYDDLKTGPRVVLEIGPGDYRVWYEAVSSSGITSVARATSTDGIAWTKRGVVMSPSLPWEKSEVSPNSILVGSGTWVLYYHGGGYPAPNGNRLGNARIGYATSSDQGLSWQKQANPVLDIGATGSFDDDQVAEPRVIRLGATYRMYYTGRNAGSAQNALGVAESPDGITWTKGASHPILDATRWGGFWGGAFFAEAGVWHLWHGVASGQSSSLHYMWSTDGLAWTDGPSNPVLSQSTDPAAADYGLVGDSVSGYRDGSEYRIMYTGFNMNLGGQGRFEGVCMASVAAACP